LNSACRAEWDWARKGVGREKKKDSFEGATSLRLRGKIGGRSEEKGSWSASEDTRYFSE